MRNLSRWDQIRTATSDTTTSSSWDTLRQKHEKTRVQKSSINTDRQTNVQADDRTAEQARFDVLLEKERNIGFQNAREWSRQTVYYNNRFIFSFHEPLCWSSNSVFHRYKPIDNSVREALSIS